MKFSKQKAKRNVARPRLDIVLAFLTPLCSSARSKLKAISLGGEGRGGGWTNKETEQLNIPTYAIPSHFQTTSTPESSEVLNQLATFSATML